MADTYQTLVTDVLLELNRVAAGDTPDAVDATFVLGKVNRILNNWNADSQAPWSTNFNTYTLTANLSPHTIGPTGTFTETQRPVSVDGAMLRLTGSSPVVEQPIALWNRQQWMRESVKGLAASTPYALFYDPSWPNGSLYLWPVPNYAYGLRLQTRYVIAAVLLTTLLSTTLPPGYRDALTLTAAEDCLNAYGAQLSPLQAQILMTKAQQARARIFANNRFSPNLATRDSGLGMGDTGSRAWDYRTGRVM